MFPPPPRSTLFPYTTLFRSAAIQRRHVPPLYPSVSRECARGRTLACLSPRSEEHTSELQSRENLVCRLLLEKKKHPTGCAPCAAPGLAPATAQSTLPQGAAL